MRNDTAPIGVSLLMYNVGFGDCFLLRFHYPEGRRHLLIDFGSTALPYRSNAYMTRVAESIRDECGGRLDALVATHRHRDHIGGFATEGGPGEIIAGCRPRLVIAPWTEDPDAATDAIDVAVEAGGGAQPSARAFLRGLGQAAELAQRLARDPALHTTHSSLTRSIHFLAEVNSLPNSSAVENLHTMARQAERRPRYVCYGADSDLESVLPGVRATVLGPPTLAQAPSIFRQPAEHSEFWLLADLFVSYLGDSATTTAVSALEPQETLLPVHARWLEVQMNALNRQQLLELIRILDKVLNNTSVILLLEAAGKKILFPGDAEIESWSYALSQPGVVDTLRDVDLYKVGHHGSRNATPKTLLWQQLARRGAAGRDRLITVLSTRKNKHGSSDDETEVPRRTLLQALEHESLLYTTDRDDWDREALFEEIRL